MRLSVLALVASTAFGAISNVQVRGVTPTQASISYTAPDAGACSVEVSESASYRPLVHDVDPVLFAGSDLDSRTESIASGRQRVFVAGKRRAEKATNGRWYSRALQAFTAHFYRVTCGSSHVNGQFATANMALGNTYNEPLPADPAVSSRPYYSAVGSYAWPEFLNWDKQDPAARSESVIDPQTGMLLKRLALPQDQPITYLPGGGDHFFDSAVDLDGAWKTPNGVLADDGTSATYTGSQSNSLLLRDRSLWIAGGTSLWDLTLPTESMTLSLKAWCSGVCAGEDAKIQACITINGVTCWPTNGTAKYQEAALGNAPTGGFVTLGTAVPILDSWTPAGYSPLNRGDLSMRRGMANVNASGLATWQAGGYPNTYFNPNWTAGSRIVIAGSDCTITAVQGLTQLTIDPASCSTALALPLTGAVFSGSNFGFLVRKKTPGTDTITLQYAKYATTSSQYIDFTASGSAKLCSNTLTQNSVTGGLGYHCVIPSGWPLLYWVDHKTGDASYLGLFGQSGASGLDGFSGGNCDGAATMGGTIPTAPETYYCTTGDNGAPSHAILISCTLNSTNQPGSASATCTNLTPASKGNGLTALVAAFTAGDTPKFDSSKYWCSLVGRQGNKLVMGCGRSVQDTLGWTVMFDPFKVGLAPGCVGGGAPGCVVAAASTWATAPARWCVAHTRFISGKTDTLWIAGKFFSPNYPPQLDDGPYVSTIVSEPLGATPTMEAGTGACPAGSPGCDRVTVDGEPCDPSPAAGEASGSGVCPKNPSWVYLQDAKVGDGFAIDGEVVILVAKNGNDWTLQRGYGLGSIAAHSTMTLSAWCMSQDFYHGISNWSWTWDTAADPHGTNSDGTTVRVAWDYDHPVPRPSATIGGLPSYDRGCVEGGSCYGVREGDGPMGDPPNRYVTLAPPFSGVGGTASYIERAQDHPSWLQDTASNSEKQWFSDGRPLTPLMDSSDAAMSVSGQLYRLTSTTSDGDNLSRVGYNIYVVKLSPTSLVAAGNCTSGNPCSIWNNTTLFDSIVAACTITLNSGSGTVYVSRIASGGLGVTYTSGLSVTTDACPASVGGGFPGGATPLWTWAANAGVWAVSGSDVRGGSSATLGGINRRIQPTWAFCGTQALIDISSPATGNVLSDTSADSYKYCVARKGGECRSGSQQGDIYANCPNAVPRANGSYGCTNQGNQDTGVDICFGNMSGYLNSVVQVGFKQNDFTGALGRSLSKALGRYRLVDGYWHGKALSDASWLMFRSMYTNGAWTDILLGKLPPYPPTDSVVRWNLQPIPVKLTPPPGLSVDNAVIQFGYAENGSPGGFFCTSRHEKCLATASTLPGTPFAFPSDGAGGLESGVAGLACASGCTIAIPAISQHMLYYQVKYRNASNQTLAIGDMEVIAIP